MKYDVIGLEFLSIERSGNVWNILGSRGIEQDMVNE